jgi:chemotaxis protein MotB
MSRKKHPEHVNHERWLVSYADFITLLFAFFVVLFASSQADRKKQSQLAAAMQTAFTPMGAFEAHSKTPPLDRTAGASSSGTPAPIQPPLPTSGTAELVADAIREAGIAAHIQKLLRESTASPKLPLDSITTHSTPEGLVISLREAGFFPSGSAEVRASSLALLAKLAASLPMAPLRVEGHTDNVPIHTAQFVSNWELSTARATVIARLVLEHSTVSPADLSAAGYAEYHPATSNATPAGRAQNRRVDIILLRRPAPSQ